MASDLEANALAVETARRSRIADRIIHVVIDEIVRRIIRPGPTAEERECYEMADELRALRNELTELALKVVNVELERTDK